MPSIQCHRPAPLTTRLVTNERTRAVFVIKPGDPNMISMEDLRKLHADPVVQAWREEGWISYDDPTPATEVETLKGEPELTPEEKLAIANARNVAQRAESKNKGSGPATLAAELAKVNIDPARAALLK